MTAVVVSTGCVSCGHDRDFHSGELAAQCTRRGCTCLRYRPASPVAKSDVSPPAPVVRPKTEAMLPCPATGCAEQFRTGDALANHRVEDHGGSFGPDITPKCGVAHASGRTCRRSAGHPGTHRTWTSRSDAFDWTDAADTAPVPAPVAPAPAAASSARALCGQANLDRGRLGGSHHGTCRRYQGHDGPHRWWSRDESIEWTDNGVTAPSEAGTSTPPVAAASHPVAAQARADADSPSPEPDQPPEGAKQGPSHDRSSAPAGHGQVAEDVLASPGTPHHREDPAAVDGDAPTDAAGPRHTITAHIELVSGGWVELRIEQAPAPVCISFLDIVSAYLHAITGDTDAP